MNHLEGHSNEFRCESARKGKHQAYYSLSTVIEPAPAHVSRHPVSQPGLPMSPTC